MSPEDFKDSVDYYLSHLSDDGFKIHIMPILVGNDFALKIWKGTEQLSYRESDLFKWSDISDDIHRFLSAMSESLEADFIYTMRKPHYWEDGYDDPVTLYREEYYQSSSPSISQIIDSGDLGDIKAFYIKFKPLGINEKINVQKFRDFINKYKKSGYISSKSISGMKDEIGLDYKDFKFVSDSVNNMYKFFNKCDDDTFSDILQYVIDDIPVINKIDLRYNVNVSSGSSLLMESFDFILEKDKSEIDVIDIIINWVEQLKEKSIEKYNHRKEEDLARRPGYIDYFTKYMLKRIKYHNLFEDLYINPGFILRVSLNEKIDWETLTNDDYDFNSDIRKARRKMKDDIVNHIKSDDCIGRYLSAIGYGGMSYDVSAETSYSDFADMFNVKVKINLMRK